MAYMRGNVYIWADDKRVHFWVTDGNAYLQHIPEPFGEAELMTPSTLASPDPIGVSLPQEVADAYVMMRLGELIDEGLVEAAAARAMMERGNFGCASLQRHGSALVSALVGLGSVPNGE